MRRVVAFGYILGEQEGATAAASMEDEPEQHCFLHEEWSSAMLCSGSMSESEAGSSMEEKSEPEPESKRPKLQAVGPPWVAFHGPLLDVFLSRLRGNWGKKHCVDKAGNLGRINLDPS